MAITGRRLSHSVRHRQGGSVHSPHWTPARDLPVIAPCNGCVVARAPRDRSNRSPELVEGPSLGCTDEIAAPSARIDRRLRLRLATTPRVGLPPLRFALGFGLF